MKKNNIYLDNGAATPIRQEVLQVMMDYYKSHFANPASFYSIATDIRFLVDIARQSVAKSLNAFDDEIYFLSGGTESVNWAIKSAACMHKNSHIITTNFEHLSVLNSVEYLEKQGHTATYLSVSPDGLINEQAVKNAITDNTTLISIMLANNEIGTILPIKKIAQIIQEANKTRARKILLHTDAIAACGHIPIDVKDLGVDLLSISSYKFYGPVAGVLYIRRGVGLESLIHGGSQERGLRAGTLDTPSILGLAKALELATAELEVESLRQKELRDYFIDTILAKSPKIKLNGHKINRLPNNINISIEGKSSEIMLMLLDSAGVYVSAGAACTSGAISDSHVIKAIGGRASESIRITLGTQTKKEDLKILSDLLEEYL